MIPPGLGHGLIVWLLRNSASAAVVALLVLLAQWLLGRRISARWCHNLWLLVIVRLLVPPLPAVKVAAPPHLALLRPLIRHVQQVTVRTDATQPRVTKHEVAPAAVLTVRTAPEFPPTDVESGKTEINIDDAAPIEAHLVRVERPWAHDFREEQPATDKSESRATPASATPIVHPLRTSRARLAQSGAQPAERSRPIPWFSIVAVMWGIVALALLLKTFLGSVRIGIAARGLRPVRDPALVELLNDCCRLLNIQSPPTLLEGPPQSGPALVGLMYPRLLLPPCVVDQFAWRELRHVILHELVHLKRRDILVNYIVSLLQAVHWFNPLVWLAAGRI